MARTPKVVEDRREQIIDAAMRVFSQKGFARATNKDIAREAGITTGLIYHYFESKEAVLKAIIETRSPLHLVESLPPQLLEQPPAVFLRFLVLQVLGISYFTIQMEVGTLRRTDPSLAAQTLIGCTMGFVLRRQLIHDELALTYTHEQIADAVIDIVLNGLLPRP